MTTLAQAIAQLEGFGKSGAIPTVANNPGNLELGDIGYGTLQASGGNNITVFPDAQSGWNALDNQIASIYNGNSKYYSPSQSLQEFGNTYSGGNPNYGSQLANMLGVPPTATLADVQPSSDGWLNKLKGIFSGNPIPPGGPPKILGTGGTGVASLIFSARLIILIIGVLLIAAGLSSFKTTQTVIEGVKKGAAVAAG